MLILCYVIFGSFYDTESSCPSAMHPPQHWHIVLLTYSQVTSINILLKHAASMFMKDIDMYISLHFLCLTFMTDNIKCLEKAIYGEGICAGFMFHVFCLTKSYEASWFWLYLLMINDEYKSWVLFYSDVIHLPVLVSIISFICVICPFHPNCLICCHKLLIRFLSRPIVLWKCCGLYQHVSTSVQLQQFSSPFLSYSN